MQRSLRTTALVCPIFTALTINFYTQSRDFFCLCILLITMGLSTLINKYLVNKLPFQSDLWLILLLPLLLIQPTLQQQRIIHGTLNSPCSLHCYAQSLSNAFSCTPFHILLSPIFPYLKFPKPSTFRLSLTSYLPGSENISCISVILGIIVHFIYIHTCLSIDQLCP